MRNTALHSCVFKIKSGLHRGVEVVLPPGEYTIGRDSTCDVVLSDSGLTDQHARLVISDDIRVLALQGRLGDQDGAAGEVVHDWNDEVLAFHLADIVIEVAPGILAPGQTDVRRTEGRIRVRGACASSSAWDDAADADEALALNRVQMPVRSGRRSKGLTPGRLALLTALLIPVLVLFYLGNRVTDHTTSASTSDPVESELNGFIDRYSIQSASVAPLDNGGWSVRGVVVDSTQADEFQIAVADAGFKVISNLQVVDDIKREVPSKIASLDPGGIIAQFDEQIGCVTGPEVVQIQSESGLTASENEPMNDVSPCFKVEAEMIANNVMTMSGFVGNQAQLRDLITQVDAGVAGISGFNTDDVVIGNVAKDAFEGFLSDAKLDRNTKVFRHGNQLRVSGNISEGALQRWSNANARFFEQFPRHILVRHEIRTGNSTPVKLQAVWAGGNPYIIVADGQIYLEGSTLSNGWVLRSINAEDVVLEFNGQTYSVAL